MAPRRTEFKDGNRCLANNTIYISGITVPETISPETTLQELGMIDEKVPIISAFLNITHNIALEVDSIPQLTLKK